MPDNKLMVVQGIEVTVRQPFEEGRVLTAVEAGVLNQVFSENVRNNFAGKVKKAVKDSEVADAESLTQPVFDDLMAQFKEYADAYEFTAASAGGGAKRVLDPIEREARAIARDLVKDALAAKGKKVSDMDKEAYAAKIIEVASNDAIVKLATKNIKARSAIADVDGLELTV